MFGVGSCARRSFSEGWFDVRCSVFLHSLFPIPHFYLNLGRQADISFHPMGIPDFYNGGVVDPIQGAIPVFSGGCGRRRADGVSAGSEVGPMVECDNT